MRILCGSDNAPPRRTLHVVLSHVFNLLCLSCHSPANFLTFLYLQEAFMHLYVHLIHSLSSLDTAANPSRSFFILHSFFPLLLATIFLHSPIYQKTRSVKSVPIESQWHHSPSSPPSLASWLSPLPSMHKVVPAPAPVSPFPPPP